MKGRGAAGIFLVAALVVGWHVGPGHAVIPDTDLAFLLPSKSASEHADAGVPSLIKPILWTVLIGIVLLGGLAVAYQRRRREEISAVIRLLASTQIAPGVTVQIIDVSSILYVVAVTRSGMTLLGEIKENDKISELRSRVAGESISLAIPPIPFKAALEKFFRRPAAPSPAADRPLQKREARESLLREALERVRRMNPSEKDKEP